MLGSSVCETNAVKLLPAIVIDPASASPYESWRQVATPQGYDPSRYAQMFGIGPQLRPAVIFECVGVPGVIQQVMAGAPSSARIVVVAQSDETDASPPIGAQGWARQPWRGS